MVGFETLLKYSPVLGTIVAVCVSFGSVKADISHLETQQQRQYDQIQRQLEILDSKIDQLRK